MLFILSNVFRCIPLRAKEDGTSSLKKSGGKTEFFLSATALVKSMKTFLDKKSKLGHQNFSSCSFFFF
jgi:hypothetical protein